MSERDGDALAALLEPGSIDRLQRRLAKGVAGFAEENLNADVPTVMAVISTHVLDLLFETARALGGAQEPGSFERWMTKTAAIIERGEHHRGAVQ